MLNKATTGFYCKEWVKQGIVYIIHMEIGRAPIKDKVLLDNASPRNYGKFYGLNFRK